MTKKELNFNVAWPTEIERVVRGVEDDELRTVEANPENVGPIGTIAFAMDMAGLTSREQSVLMLKYAFGMTLEQIGSVYGVTRERVRQVEARAIRRMRRPNVMELIKLGTVSYIRGEADKKARAMNRAFIERWDAEHQTDSTQEAESFADKLPVTSVRLEEMDLSFRAYNCLKRAMLSTLGDVIRLCESKGWVGLMTIRNMGRKSVEEVILVAKERYGVDLRSIMDRHDGMDIEVPEK